MKRILFILSFFLLSCNAEIEDIQSVISTKNETDLTTIEAKDFFTNLINNKGLRGPNLDDWGMKIDWDLSQNVKWGNGQDIVVVPILKDRNMARQLWVYKNMDLQITYRIVEYKYDLDYYRNNPNEPATVKNFTGLMRFSDINSNFLYGIVYEKSKVVGFASQEKDANAKARLSNYTCGNVETCRWTGVNAGGGGPEETYWTYTCYSDYKCFWVAGEVQVPQSEISNDFGGGEGGGTIPNFDLQNPDKAKPSTKLNECDGMKAMLERQKNEGNEVGGVMFEDGTFFIFPTSNNTRTTTEWNSHNYDLLNNLIFTFLKHNDGYYYIETYSTGGTATNSNTVLGKKRVLATYHTHPSGTNENEASVPDKTFALNYPELTHYILTTSNNKVRYNSNGSVNSGISHFNNCY